MKVIPFERLDPNDQRMLVAEFLLEYSKWSFEKRETQVYVVSTESGARYSMPYQAASKLAASFMMEDNLKARKFELLLGHMKKQGMEQFYNYVMGEELERALK